MSHSRIMQSTAVKFCRSAGLKPLLKHPGEEHSSTRDARTRWTQSLTLPLLPPSLGYLWINKWKHIINWIILSPFSSPGTSFSPLLSAAGMRAPMYLFYDPANFTNNVLRDKTFKWYLALPFLFSTTFPPPKPLYNHFLYDTYVNLYVPL